MKPPVRKKAVKAKEQPAIDDVLYYEPERVLYVIDFITQSPSGIMCGCKNELGEVLTVSKKHFTPYSKINGVKWKINESPETVQMMEKSQKNDNDFNDKNTIDRQTDYNKMINLQEKNIKTYIEIIEENQKIVEYLRNDDFLKDFGLSYSELLKIYIYPPNAVILEVNRLIKESYSPTKYKNVLEALKEYEELHKTLLIVKIFNTVISFIYSMIVDLIHGLFFKKVKIKKKNK